MSIPPFYTRARRVVIGGQLIGSVMKKCSANSSSVIMAFWPSNGNDLSSIDYSRMRVGIVQGYYKHTVVLNNADNNRSETHEHIIANVTWKQRHPHEDWFESSATVTFTLNEPSSMCSYIYPSTENCSCLCS